MYGTKFLDQFRYTAARRGKDKYLTSGSNKNGDAVFRHRMFYFRFTFLLLFQFYDWLVS